MSRHIDTSDPGSLSLDDRIYLSDRGMLPEGATVPTREEREENNERQQDPNTIVENAGATVEGGDDSEQYQTAMASLEEAHREIARLTSELEDGGGASEEDLSALRTEVVELNDELVNAYLGEPLTVPEDVTTVDDLKEWVEASDTDGEDRARAVLVLNTEQGQEVPRKSLVDFLEKFLTPDTED